jgi:hypothetical protein
MLFSIKPFPFGWEAKWKRASTRNAFALWLSAVLGLIGPERKGVCISYVPRGIGDAKASDFPEACISITLM